MFIEDRRMKMKKGITPIIATIILLLITVALAGLAWTFLSGYYTGMTAKNIQLVDFSCTGGTARVIIRNAGTESINTAACATTGTVVTCTDLTIVKTQGAMGLTQGVLPATVPAGQVATFTETGLAAGSHSYRLTTTTGAGGPSPNIATVTC
jgi:flagellin-like protein